MKKLIYIVEDDEGISEVYDGALSDDYDLKIFAFAKDFFEEFARQKPDIVLLDLMLPDMDGYAVLQQIRQKDKRLPVILVSAKSDEISYSKGLNRGADDFIRKPFSVIELLACIKANLRRANMYVSSSGDFSVDSNLYKIFYLGSDLNLTLKEFLLLRLLIGRTGETVNREELFKEGWNEEFLVETRTIDMHIASIREKMKKAGAVDCIVTVRGVGYRFENK